ncbi:uncharacterized protein LOC124159345 isoform X2 [Ischnura elegans]|uniref:uncharacterized protein LOC124159345 isoform X2 n=1 Tax=Ischnura elegans TaxID=197161 RepID=UPI001ED8BA96|nr:uncharacterized protein LOC124159345 isoform X2 [Ischnura elegans]
MNEINQIHYEAVESSCQQVTPDSNQDESLSLMRYKDLQQLAMSLNLPGNLKRKSLVDLITAKRSNRNDDVEMIINEHRVNRKPVVRRPRECEGGRPEELGDGCVVAAHFMEPSGSADYGPPGAELSAPVRNDERPRKKRQDDPQEVAATAPATSAQGPLVTGEMQSAFVAQVPYPFRYTLQASPAISSKSILASILIGNSSSQALQLKSQTNFRCSSINNYGIVSTVPVQNNNINNTISTNQYPSSSETDNYKYLANPQISSNYSSVMSQDSGSSSQESSQSDHMYSAIHQPAQMTSESNYLTPYAISHPAYTALTHYTNIPSSYSHLQQPCFSQHDSGGSSVYYGYPHQVDATPNEVVNPSVGKQSLSQVYGQNIFTNQRITDNGYAASPLDDPSRKHGTHMSHAGSQSPALSNNTAKCWGNGSSVSTGMGSQDMHKKSQLGFGNINSVWHYQGMALNYNNNAPVGHSVVAHDLTVPSRRTPQDNSLGNSSLVKDPIVHPENLEEKASYHDYSESGSQSSCHSSKSNLEVENSCETPLTHSADCVQNAEQSHLTESMPQTQQSPQCCEERSDGNPSPAESNSMREGVEQGRNLSTQLSNSQVNVHEASKCPQEPISRDAQHMPYSGESGMNYWSSVYPSVKTCHSPHYYSGFNTRGISVYGVAAPNNNSLPCSDSDAAKYSHQSATYQTLVNSNSCLSSPIQSSQYNHSMGVCYDYRYGQGPYTNHAQSSYSPCSGQENSAGMDSTNVSNDNADGYLQEQPCAENYITPNSMESMWSSAQSTSNDFENPLVASSPVSNELEGVQNSCMEGVFPDEGDLEMEDEQGLAFPNIYDYVMGSAEDEGESAMSAKMGEEGGVESDNPTSPGSSCGQGKKEPVQDETLTEDQAESACEESDGSKNDNTSLASPSKDKRNASGSSTSAGKSSTKRRNSSSLDSSGNDETEKGTPVVALKRRSQSSRIKSSKIHPFRGEGGKGRRSSSVRRSGSCGKTIIRKDIISCTCDHGNCSWVGRIPTMASHIISLHSARM